MPTALPRSDDTDARFGTASSIDPHTADGLKVAL